MNITQKDIDKAYSRYCELCASNASNRRVNTAWNKYQRLVNATQPIPQYGLGLPVLNALIDDKPGPEWRDVFVSMVSGNITVVLSRNNKYDGHVDSFILSHDNYFANVLTANRGRVAVNTRDWERKCFTDVTLSVALSQL